MHTMTTSTHTGLLAGTLLVLSLVTAACGGASVPATPGASPDPGVTAPVAPDPTTVPGGSSAPGAGTGSGSSSGSGGGVVPVPIDPGAGGGGVVPVPIDPGAGGGGIVDPEPAVVVPGAGLTGIHEVRAAKLEVSVDGRKVAVRVAWWSGIEPCSVLAGVAVVRDGTTITLTVQEGSGAGPDVACTMQAVYKATIVDLGELEPGTYTIGAFGGTAPVEVTISG